MDSGPYWISFKYLVDHSCYVDLTLDPQNGSFIAMFLIGDHISLVSTFNCSKPSLMLLSLLKTEDGDCFKGYESEELEYKYSQCEQQVSSSSSIPPLLSLHIFYQLPQHPTTYKMQIE
ncbi:hypothetical protein P8452_41029 [Trifolium repens]|nr:hypothetical protein P8452_41029 [Trifolium repens]